MQIMGNLCIPQIVSKFVCFASLQMVFGYDFVDPNVYVSKTNLIAKNLLICMTCLIQFLIILKFKDARQNIIAVGLSSASLKSFFHLMQLWKSGKFRKYDYLENNLEVYGQKIPPLYDIGKITAPVALYCGSKDYLVSCRVKAVFLINSIELKIIYY